ncbi:MAG: ATP-binding cassette domain-containing protein [Bacteroidales bacterium]|nr:ATP-binding cassette domain-containing protein [Bacteroidales bacterium]
MITGVSGSGKTSLVDFLLQDTIRHKKGGTGVFKKVIHIDASPIGRTPKSNPATYTGMSDHIRDLMASLPESKQRGYKKGQFSFVVKGGRCEDCGGAGVQQIGMHFLGNVEVVCETCNGKRFTDQTLEVGFKGLSISDILELTIDEAHSFLRAAKITGITGILSELGLGYLKLGQPSTTLSGGEAQRVKLAYELARTTSNQTLYILDEPTTGLHMADTEVLLKALRKLVDKGNTLLCIEHDSSFILQSDWMVDLGPGSASDGGKIVAEGIISEVIDHPTSLTAIELRRYLSRDVSQFRSLHSECSTKTIEAPIQMSGVETNNLKNIDVSFEANAITVVTGVSGSGKSSLVYGTLFAESQRRFLEGMSSYNRQFTAKAGIPILKESRGLIPAISLQKKNPVKNPRSTIATYTGLYDLYRLLYSRLSTSGTNLARPLSTAFSYNGEGACPVCKGLGSLRICDAGKLISSPEKSLISGALDGSKAGRFYGDPFGQYVATLLTVGIQFGIDFSVPFRELGDKAREIALSGCGEQIFDVEWKYKRGAHEGVHHLKSGWPGFLKLVEEEYLRKHDDARGEALMELMKTVDCSNCKGYRLKPEMLQFIIGGLHIGKLTEFSTDDAIERFSKGFLENFNTELEKQAAKVLRESISERLNALQQAGLGYISTNRIVGTLSGGEFQRLQLAGLVRAPLTGVVYILDEPSFGLHPKDIKRISDLILKLNKHGNSVIMLDNSQLMIENSEFTLELGPAAGSNGGQIMYSGKTKDYQGDDKIISKQIQGKPGEGLQIRGAYANNLQNIDVNISSGILTAITGVSGSGKTSLLEKVIYESFTSGKPVNCKGFQGAGNFSGLIYIEQSAPGTGHTATVGSKLGITDAIAGIFSTSGEAKLRGFKPPHFVGAREGRCPACDGTGSTQVSMDFFNDIISPCERCGGTGFRDEVLEVLVDGKNIYETLQLTFDECLAFFKDNSAGKSDKRIRLILDLIQKTGLGHLSPGRSLKTLSTGELQRLKLVSGLSTDTGNNTLILLDEPTGGLHPKDIYKLLLLFTELQERGNTLICVTHEPLLMVSAQKVIELGPKGGNQGGRIMHFNT